MNALQHFSVSRSVCRWMMDEGKECKCVTATCCSHLQSEVVLLAGGDVQQCGAGLTRSKHQLHVPGDRGSRHVVPLQQTVTQETLRAGHHWSKKVLKNRINC